MYTHLKSPPTETGTTSSKRKTIILKSFSCALTKSETVPMWHSSSVKYSVSLSVYLNLEFRLVHFAMNHESVAKWLMPRWMLNVEITTDTMHNVQLTADNFRRRKNTFKYIFVTGGFLYSIETERESQFNDEKWMLPQPVILFGRKMSFPDSIVVRNTDSRDIFSPSWQSKRPFAWQTIHPTPDQLLKIHWNVHLIKCLVVFVYGQIPRGAERFIVGLTTRRYRNLIARNRI